LTYGAQIDASGTWNGEITGFFIRVEDRGEPNHPRAGFDSIGLEVIDITGEFIYETGGLVNGNIQIVDLLAR
jgi:hypothetical protein